MPKKQEFHTTDPDALLYYATFDSELLSTDLQQDLREIKATGFGGLVLRDLPADKDADTARAAAHAVRFVKTVRENGLACRLDLAASANSTDAGVRTDALSAFLNACRDAEGLAGIDVPWPAEPPFSAAPDAPAGSLPARSADAPARHDARKNAAETLLREKTVLQNTGRELFGPGFTVRYYGTRAPISPGTAEFTPKSACAEIREIGHAENLDRRPDDLLVLFKEAASLGAAAGTPRPPVIIWGEDYATARAGHPADIVSYWADLAGTYHTAWQGWMYVRENRHFYRLIKKGVSHPYHPSWKRFPGLLQKTALMAGVLGNARPAGTLALIRPTATFEAYEGGARDALEAGYRQLAAHLVRAGYQFDIVPDDLLTRSSVDGASLSMGGKTYTELIYPMPETIPHNGWKNLCTFVSAGARCLFMGMPAAYTTTGADIRSAFQELLQMSISPETLSAVRMTVGTQQVTSVPAVAGGWERPAWQCSGTLFPVTADRSQIAVRRDTAVYVGILPGSCVGPNLDELLKEAGFKIDISMPNNALINILTEKDEVVFAVTPAEYGGIVSGRFTWSGFTFEATDCREAFAVRIDTKSGEVVSHAVCGEAEVRVEQDID